MSTQVILPRLGFSMNEGEVAEWLAADGDMVQQGAPLYVLESDKSSTEIESPASGRLTILKPANETFEVGTVLGEIV